MFLHCGEVADRMNVYMREIETWSFHKSNTLSPGREYVDVLNSMVGTNAPMISIG